MAARGLSPDEAFVEQLEALVADAAGRDLILLSIRETLCLDPTVGNPMDDPPGVMWYYFVPEAPPWGIPRLTVVYSFDDDTVYLNWIDHSTKQPGLI